MNYSKIEKESDSCSESTSADFYQAFMEHFRGPFETIKIQLRVYLPFIHTLTRFYPDAQILDLGSGRGEWLELLKEQGISAYGVDTNERLITSSKERGLNVICANALEHLKMLSAQSLSVITAFHLVEHLPFDELRKLVEEAHRILLPGGLLILETPNPENILVGTSTFYMDPTHQRPIPPDLLAFLPKYYGFPQIKILRLQKGLNVTQKPQLTLFEVLSKVSPDYSVMAQKNAPLKIRKAIRPLFAMEYGVNLEQLAAVYNQQLESKLNSIPRLTAPGINKSRSFKLVRDVQHQFYNKLQTLQFNFKKKQFYKAFRTYWRSLEKKTGKQRHLLKKWGKQAYLSLSTWSFLKQNTNKSEPTLGHMVPPPPQATIQEITPPFCLERYMASSGKPQMLIDISELVNKDHRTGVQRVVRSILRQWLLNPPENWTIQPIYATKYEGYRYARRFTLKLLGIKKTTLSDDPISFKSGDIFFGLDFSRPIVIAQQPFYQILRAQGVTTSFLVHDLLPVYMPHYFPEGVRDLHCNWLEVISQSNALFCVSKNTAQELKKWILKNEASNASRPQLHWFHLGADIKSSIPNSGFPLEAESILKQIQEGFTFLMVGTLEPRKGYTQALEAFELLWQSGLIINLVIAGKYGWMMEDFIGRLKKHPHYGVRLFWIDNASDEYLQVLYSAATCLIFASEGEGFGLPLIEAAHHELPVIARDIPVFREIAGAHIYYFNGLHAAELMEAVNEWIKLFHQGLISSPSNMPKRSWEQSAVQLLSNILSLK